LREEEAGSSQRFHWLAVSRDLGPKSESLSLRRSLSAEILGILFDEGRREASGSCDSELWALANKFVIDSGEILVFFSSCQLFSHPCITALILHLR
jgi:hypothetical protein